MREDEDETKKPDPKKAEDKKPDAKPKASSARVEIGARVKFFPTHNKALELVGTLEDVQKDIASVAVEPDGKIIEISQTHIVPLREIRLANDSDSNRHIGDRG